LKKGRLPAFTGKGTPGSNERAARHGSRTIHQPFHP
jgi:hypothetical protein